jgi:hypothetical protein
VNQPLADLITELEQDERPITPTRTRQPTQQPQRFRQSNTGIGRLGANAARRPMAQASPPTGSIARPVRRGSTEVQETDINDFASPEVAVDDSQLVDWQGSEETNTSTSTNDDFNGRKR